MFIFLSGDVHSLHSSCFFGALSPPSCTLLHFTLQYLISDAEKKGALNPGGTVVEGTAGNTGIGLAHMCRARGYKCIIYIPETQSKEKMDALR